jgi:hypothetical protein
MSATVAWQCQTQFLYPGAKKEPIQEIRSWKKHLSEWAWCQKAISGGTYFSKKWKAETLQPGLELDNFKPRLKSDIFKCISWLNGLLFRGDDQGFLKVGVMTYLRAPMSPVNSPTFFFLSSHLQSMVGCESTQAMRTARSFLKIAAGKTRGG